MANVAWNAMKSMSGMLPFGCTPTPLKKAMDRSPTHAPPSPNASEYPTRAQSTPVNPKAMKLIIIVFRTFLERTRPP